MSTRVAIVEFDRDYAEALGRAIQLIGGADGLNSPQRSVVVKVGVFDHAAKNHASVGLVKAIADSFDKAPKVFLAESDNYRGKALERLRVWEGLFSDRLVPADLSDESDARRVTLAGQEMCLSNALFKPNVLVSTHILRSFERGSILKNLFGCVPYAKKAKYHGVLPSLLADIYETVGGIDLAVMDGTYFWRGAGTLPIKVDTILVGKDAVAVEAVGATLAGLRLEKMPVLQEFIKRGLGEGNLKNIEMLGAPLEALKAKFGRASKQHAKEWREQGGATTIWAPAIDDLIREGFFRLPNKRTREEVKEALLARLVPAEGNMNLVTTTLTRRVSKGVLKGERGPRGWVYWTEGS